MGGGGSKTKPEPANAGKTAAPAEFTGGFDEPESQNGVPVAPGVSRRNNDDDSSGTRGAGTSAGVTKPGGGDGVRQQPKEPAWKSGKSTAAAKNNKKKAIPTDDDTDAYAQHILRQTEDLDGGGVDAETAMDDVLDATDDLSSGPWNCVKCKANNKEHWNQCAKCGMQKPESKKKEENKLQAAAIKTTRTTQKVQTISRQLAGTKQR